MANDTNMMVEINEAVAELARSERGRQAMRDTLAMLDNGGSGLDQFGATAMITILVAAFGSHRGSARDAMRNAIGG